VTDSKQLPRAKWHPFYATLFDHSAAKSGAELTHPWGHSVFRVRGKTFVFLGSPDDPGLTVKPYTGSRDVLLASGKVTVAHYIGRYGWVSMRVDDTEQLKLALDLIDESYEHNIPKRVRESASKPTMAKSDRTKRPASHRAAPKKPKATKTPAKKTRAKKTSAKKTRARASGGRHRTR